MNRALLCAALALLVYNMGPRLLVELSAYSNGSLWGQS